MFERKSAAGSAVSSECIIRYSGNQVFCCGNYGFINIHHYFIDNVLWRFRSREVPELLFG
jgi:hypothetical protein